MYLIKASWWPNNALVFNCSWIGSINNGRNMLCIIWHVVYFWENVSTRTAPRKTRSESRNQFPKASRQQIRPHHSSRLSAVCMIWCETVPHQIMLSGFLCLLVIWFTYKSAFRMLVEMSLAQSPVFLWSNFSHHSIGQWTLSCSNIPTLFKLQSLVVLKPSD